MVGRIAYLTGMAMVSLDTHATVKELKAAGFSEGQAEALTDVVRKSREFDLATLATKADLTTLESRLEARIERTSSDLFRWIIGLIGFQALTLLAAVVGLARLGR